MQYRFLVRGGLAAAVASLNEVVFSREIELETDTGKFKFGDGVTPYNSLPYYGANLWQPLDADLTAIAALTPSNDDILQRKAGAWTNRSMSQLAADLPTIATTKGGTGLTSYTTGDLLYASATNTLSKLAAGTNTYVLTMVAGVPAWAAPAAAGQAAIQFKDEGSNLGSSGAITSVDFTGTGITASAAGTALTVNVASGSVGVGAQIGYAYTESATTATSASGTNFPLDNTIPQSGEGVAYASLDTTITPTASTSFLEVDVFLPWVSLSATGQLTFGIFRDSGANALLATTHTIEAPNSNRSVCLRIKVAAGSTSATTFKLRWGNNSGTGYINYQGTTFFGGVVKATMTVREIKQ